MDIISYHQAISYIAGSNNWTIPCVKAVVFDEAHFFLADSSFNSDTSFILQQLIKRFYYCKRIYMSATPEEVKPILSYEELNAFYNYIYFGNRLINEYHDLNPKDNPLFMLRLSVGSPTQASKAQESSPDSKDSKGKEASNDNLDDKTLSDSQEKAEIQPFPLPPPPYPCFAEYVFQGTFNHVNLHFFHSWYSIETTARDETLPDKWLIFVRTKKDGEKLKEKIGDCAEFIDADRKKEDNERFQALIRDEEFDYKVLISTTVLYNGVSLKEDALKHIVVDSVNKTEVIQMLGRKRCKEDESVNLYVHIPPIEELEERQEEADTMLEYMNQYLNDPNHLFEHKWEADFFDLRLTKPSRFLYGKFYVSAYAPILFAQEAGNYARIIKTLKKFREPFTLEKEICGWFNKTFCKEMLYGETAQQAEERIKGEVIEYLELLRKKEPIELSQGETILSNLIEIITPIKGKVEATPLKNGATKGKPRKLGADPQKVKADINRIIKFTSWPYVLSKADSVYTFKEDWNALTEYRAMKEELAGSEAAKEMLQEYGTAEQAEDTFTIYQLKDDVPVDYHFRSLERLQEKGLAVDPANYEKIYTAPLTPGMGLERIFEKFNFDRPEDFKGHSLSVSDVVVLHQNGQDTAHYTDSIGFVDISKDFLLENPLKAAELSTEQNANMIDGVINNTPAADALEANAGEQISLEQYAETLKQDDSAEPDIARITAAAKSRYDGMVALFTMNDKIYIGKSENYDNKGHYDNKDNSLLYVSDCQAAFTFLSSEGCIYPQDEALNRGIYTKEDYEEFSRITDFLSQAGFTPEKEFCFDKKPFSLQADTPEQAAPETKTIYYTINEGAARRANDANSYYDYKPGSATAGYRQMVDKAVEIGEQQKKRICRHSGT